MVKCSTSNSATWHIVYKVQPYPFDVSNIFHILMKTEAEEEGKGKDKEENTAYDKEEEEIEREVMLYAQQKFLNWLRKRA